MLNSGFPRRYLNICRTSWQWLFFGLDKNLLTTDIPKAISNRVPVMAYMREPTMFLYGKFSSISVNFSASSRICTKSSGNTRKLNLFGRMCQFVTLTLNICVMEYRSCLSWWQLMSIGDIYQVELLIMLSLLMALLLFFIASVFLLF